MKTLEERVEALADRLGVRVDVLTAKLEKATATWEVEGRRLRSWRSAVGMAEALLREGEEPQLREELGL